MKNDNIRITILIIFTFICISFKSFDDGKIKKIQIQLTSPIFKKSGEIQDYKTGFVIYYNKKYEIYEIPISQRYTISKRDTAILDSISIASQYLVVEKGKEKGLFYSNNTVTLVKKDSLISKKMSFGNVDIDSLNSFLKKTQLISILTLPDSSVEEKYIPINKNETNVITPDTLCYYFSEKMKGVHYSFSTFLDNFKSSKYIGYKYSFNSRNYPNLPFLAPNLQQRLEMKEIPINNEKDILKLIRKYNEYSICK